MASGIAVTPEQLREVSAQVGAGAAEVDAILSRLTAAVAPVRSEWVGAAQVQFEALWDRWRRDTTHVHSMLTGLARLTQDAAMAYAATEETVASSFDDFSVELGTSRPPIEPAIVQSVAAGFSELVETFEALVGGRLDLADNEDANSEEALLPQPLEHLVEQSQAEMKDISEQFSQIQELLSATAFDYEPVDSHVATQIEEGLVEEVEQSVDRPEARTRPPWTWFPKSKSVARDSETVSNRVASQFEESLVEETRFEEGEPSIDSQPTPEKPSQYQSLHLDAPRLLNQAEQGILDALLTPEFPGVEELRAQVPYVRVVAECDCGCPSIDLLVPSDIPPSRVTTYNHLAPVKGWVTPESDEMYAKIILCVDDGRITSLEYVFNDDPAPSDWPHLDRLAVERTDRPVNAGDRRV